MIQTRSDRGYRFANTWIGRVALGTLAVSVGLLVSPFAEATRSQIPVRVRSVEAEGVATTVADRAAAFAARALASAGLLDPSATLYGLDSSRQLGDREWAFTFRRSECLATDVTESCYDTGQTAVVTVAATGESFTIRRVEGLQPNDAGRVAGYRESRSDQQPGWTFPQVVVHDRPGASHFEGAALWEGPIGAVGLGSKCRPGIRDDSTGEILWVAERSIELAPPQSPEDRLGMILTLGAVPADAPSGTAFVECDGWSGGGWRAEHSARATLRPVPDKTGYEVTVDLSWVGDPFAQAFSECVFTVRQADRLVLGSSTRTIPPVRLGDRVLEITEFVPVKDAARATYASVICRPITSQDFEMGGSR